MSDQNTLQGHAIPVDDFELQPRLVGELVEARPLKPQDWQSLFAVASDPLVWEQHPAHDRYKEDVFREFFQMLWNPAARLSCWIEKLGRSLDRRDILGSTLRKAKSKSVGHFWLVLIGAANTTVN